jgi:epoxide hydrolase
MTAPTPPAPAPVRPFTVSIPDPEIEDVKQRLARTRWPDPETVSDWSQGVRLANARSLIGYWEHSYDWGRLESRLNRFPQFLTEIDGLDIHFIHLRSPNPGAMPLILTHGWPGSTIDFLKLTGPLTDPVSSGADAADSFDLVIPSLPGSGFSGKPTHTGWTAERTARAWAELMNRLGYTRWAAHGGDWGAVVTTAPKPTTTGWPRTPSAPTTCSTRYPSTGSPTPRRRPPASTGKTKPPPSPAPS